MTELSLEIAPLHHIGLDKTFLLAPQPRGLFIRLLVNSTSNYTWKMQRLWVKGELLQDVLFGVQADADYPQISAFASANLADLDIQNPHPGGFRFLIRTVFFEDADT